VRGKERYETDCTNGPSGLDSARLSPGGPRNEVVRDCGRVCFTEQRKRQDGVLGGRGALAEWASSCSIT
jgi:hypothetical protein